MKEEMHAQKNINAREHSLPKARKRKFLVYKCVLLYKPVDRINVWKIACLALEFAVLRRTLISRFIPLNRSCSTKLWIDAVFESGLRHSILLLKHAA